MSAFAVLLYIFLLFNSFSLISCSTRQDILADLSTNFEKLRKATEEITRARQTGQLIIQEPKLKANGLYSDSVMNRATEIVSGYFEMYVTDHYDTNPFQYSVISSAFESVFLEMKIDSTIMMPIIFTNNLNEYYGLTSKFINDESVFDIQDANDVAKCVVVLIQEGYPNTLKYTKEQFLVFFEFLFRFGVDGIRFDAAQQFLLEGLKNDNLSDIYNIIFKYFDPISSLLPSIFLKKNRKDPQELANYLNFVRFSNAKMLAIEDSTKYSTIYSKNILAALYNIEVFGFNEGLSEGICELIQRVDIKMLTGNHLFMKVFEESKRLGSALSSCADSILSRIINDEFLGELSMDPNFFFKSIFLGFLIKDLNYSSYTLGLSQQSMKILDEINMQCSKYHWAIKLFSKFNTLEAEFINMSAPELVDLCKDVSELTKFLPVCFEVKTVQANSAIGKLIGILTNLISASIRDTADPNLNIERYKTFVKLL